MQRLVLGLKHGEKIMIGTKQYPAAIGCIKLHESVFEHQIKLTFECPSNIQILRSDAKIRKPKTD